jgi:acyl-CoA thioesterase FadM
VLDVALEIDELKDKSVKYGFKVANKETTDLLAVGYLVVVAVDKRALERLKPFQKQIL